MTENETDETQCRAAANQRGEHIPCDWPAPHDGWAHSNREHELLWSSPTDRLHDGEAVT